MKNDHIHLRGEIKTVQWSADGLPESVTLDTNTQIEIPVSSLIDPDALVEGAVIEVDGETNLRSTLAPVHHAQVKVDGRLVADGSHLPHRSTTNEDSDSQVQVIGHVQSIAFQLGGLIDHLVLNSGLVVRIDPCCEVSDDLSIGDSIQVIGSSISDRIIQAESVTFVKNAH